MAATAAQFGADGWGDEGRLVGLAAAVDALVSVRVDVLDDATVGAELEAVEAARRRLEARSCRLAQALSRREARRARAKNPGDGRAGQRAARLARKRMADRLNWTPRQAKQAVDDGDKLDSMPAAGPAADAGEVSARHARILADTLKHFAGERRDRLEAELLAAAKTQDATTFARTCRARLADEDHDAAMADQARRHGRRRATLGETDDGMTTLSGRWAGLDAETVATAIHAFRRPDRPGEHRQAAQRTADAVVDALAAALRGGHPPAGHGVRPHVTVTVRASDVARDAGSAEAAWTGPVAYGEVRRLLDDAGLAWLALDDDGVPLAGGRETRSVPAGLWRALVARDKGCIAEGCDAPPAWCDVMHLHTAHAAGGRLTLDNAGLGCRHHHRRYDLGGWQVTWHHGRPTMHPPRRHPPDTTTADDPTPDDPDDPTRGPRDPPLPL